MYDMAIQKKANATWTGSLKEGKGTVSLESGAMEKNPFGFNTRFEDKPGTNPEELIAAAHASCFSMALSNFLGQHDMTAESIITDAVISLEKVDGGFSVTKSHLTLELTVKGGDKARMEEAATGAKENCPISNLLDCEIMLDATYNN